MDQERIGKFILEQRKKKKLTQQELAEKLGVTDRAVSNWENGKNMPDLSMFKPICEELGITINELLCGEKITEEEYQVKADTNILNTIDYSKKKIVKTRNKFIIVLLMVIIILILFVILFCVDINRMSNNEEVFFSTWGFDYMPPVNLSDEEILLSIEKYLVLHGDKNVRYDNEKTFVAIKTYLIDEIEEDKLYYIYCWVLEESYYLENDMIKQNSGSSIPYRFVVEKIEDKYEITDSRIPRDGSYYPVDMKKMFPYFVRKEMNNVYKDGTIDKLELEIKKQVELYYHK